MIYAAHVGIGNMLATQWPLPAIFHWPISTDNIAQFVIQPGPTTITENTGPGQIIRSYQKETKTEVVIHDQTSAFFQI